ncbi:vesicle-associated membrane protein-associated protein B-like [Artemia franciscana]|uniref:vesicle-associated membrane protein-associated protein B-like n=1 Tax=Artemia franciscana TaxID=6661 RepID=UPI0032DA222D
MSHTMPLIAVEPENELRFKGPFNGPSTATMVISNKTEKRVCFKVKTTAPRKYCVKPTTGVLEANSSVTILVSLQPFDINDPAERGKHKFQVLSVAVPEGMINLDNVWKEVAPEDIHDWKLKCILDLPPHVEGIVPKKSPELGAAIEQPDATPPRTQTELKQSSPQIEKKLLEADQRAVEEINRLREDIARMTQDNLKLREESIRMNRAASIGESKADNFARAHAQPIAEPMTYTTIIFVLVAVLLGYIAGKIY